MSFSQNERTNMMLNEPISKVIPHLAIPTIISMLITSIYNMADTFFVGQISTSASGAVGVFFSAMAFIQAIAFTIGMGSGTNVSQSLGAKKEERARVFVSTGFFLAFGVGIVVSVLTLTNLDWLIRFLGATETIIPHAREYGQFILYASPFMMCSFVMNNLLRFEGLAIYGMVGIGFGGILNMILDPILIFGLKMGVGGAGLATAISQCVSFAILLFMTQTRKAALSIHPKNFAFDLKIIGRIFYNGFPSLGRQGLASISTILLNNMAREYGDAAIAAISIVNRFVMFINSTVIGFGQGFQPVCGFCFGARRYKRVCEAFWFCVKVSTGILLVLGAVSFIFAEPIVAFFRNDVDVIRIGTLSLRLQLLTLPLWGFIIMSNMFTQSIGYGVRATIISASRQGLFLIPGVLIFPRIFHLLGLQIAPPISDIMSLLLAFFIVRKILRDLQNNENGTI